MNFLNLLQNLAASKERLVKDNLMVLEGRHLVRRYLEKGSQPLGVVCVPSAYEEFKNMSDGHYEVIALTEPELGNLVGFPFHRGVLALANRPSFIPLGEAIESNQPNRLIVSCPRITDEANLGAILRTSLALGLNLVLLGPGSADPFSRKALRTSMGASFDIKLALCSEQDLLDLKSRGFRITGAALCPGAIPLSAYRPGSKQIVVFGHETEGLPSELRELCDDFVGIPMHHGVDSLNVAVSAGIILYQLTAASRPNLGN